MAPIPTSAAPENLAGPVVGGQLAITPLDAATSGAVAFPTRLTFVLAVVLHRAVAKVDELFLPVGAGLDHHFLAGAGASARTVAGHLVLVDSSEWHNYKEVKV